MSAVAGDICVTIVAVAYIVCVTIDRRRPRR
jgi:hypothetical protein